MDIGDTVLHPRYGVGIIDAIERREQDGECREYYVIPKPSICSTIFVPVDAADELGLRPVSSRDKLQEALHILTGDGEGPLNEGLRNLTWGDPLALAGAIRRGVTEPKSRYPKVSEQHQLKRAKKLLAEEMSVVLGMSEERVIAMIDDPGPETDQRLAAGV
ncbi:MAG: CarD family transcriptional regulator [Armatimonadota bacterium]